MGRGIMANATAWHDGNDPLSNGAICHPHEQENKITIYGLKADGAYVVEFRTGAGEWLAISC